jgi:hypothetical protein
MPKRKITDTQMEIRKRYEAELRAIQPLTPAARKLLSHEGFCDYFNEICMLYPSKWEAYETLEEVHEEVFGFRKYSEFDSFRYAVKVKRRPDK